MKTTQQTAAAEMLTEAPTYRKPQVMPYGRIEPSLTGSLPGPPPPPI